MSHENGADSSAPEVKTGGTAPPSAATPKRGPGRPRKDGLPSGSVPLGETPIGEGPKRGRPKKERVELDKAAVARQLLGSHQVVAMFLGLPELMLTEKEAEVSADAICEFSREYDFAPDPKLMASINLIATFGMVYVPKVIKIAARVKKTKAARGQTIDGEAKEVPSAGHAGATAN